jgi:uncharacterized membrane protein YozB (DUF420 family)
VEIVLKLANVAVFVVICVGVAVHRRRRLHVGLMLTSFALDLALLVVVELLRGAVGQAVGVVSPGGAWALRIHILFSLAAGVMWLVMIHSGCRLLRGGEEYRGRHSRGARLFLAVRFGNMVTAFLV